MQKIDVILKQVQDEAKAVPELRQQMAQPAALQQNPAGALAAGGSKAVKRTSRPCPTGSPSSAILANKEANPLPRRPLR